MSGFQGILRDRRMSPHVIPGCTIFCMEGYTSTLGLRLFVGAASNTIEGVVVDGTRALSNVWEQCVTGTAVTFVVGVTKVLYVVKAA